MSMSDRVPPRQILKYYVYVATAWGGFHLPIDVLLFRSRGLSFGEIGIVAAVGGAVTLVMEIPSGYVADRIGRRNSLLLSSGLMTAGATVFALAGAFRAFALAQATFVLGIAFRSGTADAWLYDTLADSDRTEEFARVSGRGQTALLVVLGVTSVAGGYLGEIDFGLAYLATAGTTAISFLTVSTFDEPPRTDDDDRVTLVTVRTTLRTELARPELRAVVAGLALFFGVVTTINAVLIQPASVAAGVSVGQLGWLFGSFTAAGAAISYVSGWVKENVGLKRTLVAAPFVVAAALGVGGVAVVAIVPGFVAMRAVQRLVSPLAGQYINDRLSSVGRAGTECRRRRTPSLRR